METKFYQKPIERILIFLSLILLGSKLHLLDFLNTQPTLRSWNKLYFINVHHDEVEFIELLLDSVC